VRANRIAGNLPAAGRRVAAIAYAIMVGVKLLGIVDFRAVINDIRYTVAICITGCITLSLAAAAAILPAQASNIFCPERDMPRLLHTFFPFMQQILMNPQIPYCFIN